jgi:hypothetical protein
MDLKLHTTSVSIVFGDMDISGLGGVLCQTSSVARAMLRCTGVRHMQCLPPKLFRGPFIIIIIIIVIVIVIHHRRLVREWELACFVSSCPFEAHSDPRHEKEKGSPP